MLLCVFVGLVWFFLVFVFFLGGARDLFLFLVDVLVGVCLIFAGVSVLVPVVVVRGWFFFFGGRRANHRFSIVGKGIAIENIFVRSMERLLLLVRGGLDILWYLAPL